MLNCCYQQMVTIFVQRVGKLEKPVSKMKKSKISEKKKKKKRGHLQIFTILYCYASIQIGWIFITNFVKAIVISEFIPLIWQFWNASMLGLKTTMDWIWCKKKNNLKNNVI